MSEPLKYEWKVVSFLNYEADLQSALNETPEGWEVFDIHQLWVSGDLVGGAYPNGYRIVLRRAAGVWEGRQDGK